LFHHVGFGLRLSDFPSVWEMVGAFFALQHPDVSGVST